MSAYLSTVSSLVVVAASFAPIPVQAAIRIATIVIALVACAFAFSAQRMWIAFTLLIDAVYLAFETAFRETLAVGNVDDSYDVVERIAFAPKPKPKLIKSRAMHHGVWAGALVFQSIVAFGYGRFSGPAYLGTALTIACVLIWVPPNFRTEFSVFDSAVVNVKHRATIVSLVSWRLVTVTAASTNLTYEAFWCYVGFAVLMPIIMAAMHRSKSIYFDASIQIEAWVVSMLVFVRFDSISQTPPPIELQWVVAASGFVFVAYTIIKLAKKYPERVLNKKITVAP